MDLIGLSGFADRKISECSKGMRRRTAFGQALIHDPELLILDEPTSGYDPIGMKEVKDLIQKLRSEGKNDSHLFSPVGRSSGLMRWNRDASPRKSGGPR